MANDDDTLQRIATLEAHYESLYRDLRKTEEGLKGDIMSANNDANIANRGVTRLDVLVTVLQEQVANGRYWSRWAVAVAVTTGLGFLARVLHGILQ